MPSSMPHLIVAKKINPHAGINFYIGNLAPDANRERKKKDKAHFENIPDIETALKEFALKADNDYLKGFLLHLYVDWKWKSTHLIDFINKTGDQWFPQYREEISKITSYAFHNTEWADDLYKQLENWDYTGFAETEFITKENITDSIRRNRKWQIENKLESSSAFPPALIEKFANDTADDFIKWFADLTS